MNELHRHARAIFDHALSAVDPRQAVKHALSDHLEGPIYSVAIGKAAVSMALGLEETLGDKLTAGVLTSSQSINSARWQSFIGGHPLPNQDSLAAAQAAFALLDRANAQAATIVFLISGGGSAMIEWPLSDEISLADLQSANQTLISCGAHIAEVNAVRRAFSAVKGGALAQRAPRARTLTLIVSDTNPGDEASVASGPTLTPPCDSPRATEVVAQYRLESVLPPSIMKTVREEKAPATTITETYMVLLDNDTAIASARDKAGELGFSCTVLKDVREQPIAEGCELLLSNLLAPSTESLFCALSGGEFSCPVRGDGRGGRNLETALRCAMGLAGQTGKSPQLTVLSAGTDGIDGNSPAAGAIADEATIQRAQKLGLDAGQYLARSDSYGFFERLGDLIVTGPTRTNVRDLRILLRSP